MAFKHSMAIANFTCRFGDKKVLLDLFHEIIYPAFFDSPPRSYAKNSFYLFDLEFLDVGRGKFSEPVIAGQFVRDMGLTRSHVLRNNKLIPDKNSMESATSARFVLILSSHTLLYVADTPHAPPLGLFRSTIQHHLTASWKKFIKAESKKQRKANKNGETLREIALKLAKEVPPPELNLIELPSSISIQQFLAKFKEIDRVEYKINDTNHSIDFSPFISSLRDQKNVTESKQIVVVESKPKNRSALTQQLDAITRDGNVDAKISGKATTGGKISGSNENFKMSAPLTEVPSQMKKFIRAAYSKFAELVNNKEITVQRATGTAADKLRNVAITSKTLND